MQRHSLHHGGYVFALIGSLVCQQDIAKITQKVADEFHTIGRRDGSWAINIGRIFQFLISPGSVATYLR